MRSLENQLGSKNGDAPPALDTGYVGAQHRRSLYRLLARNIVRQLLDSGHQGHELLPFVSEVMQAITDNARRMIELDEEYGTFQKYLRSHDSFWDLVRDLRKQFKFLGDMGAYHWLYVVGEDVPPHDQFEAERPPRKQRK